MTVTETIQTSLRTALGPPAMWVAAVSRWEVSMLISIGFIAPVAAVVVGMLE